MKAPRAPWIVFGYFTGDLEQVFPSRFINSGGISGWNPMGSSDWYWYPPITRIVEEAGREWN